MTPLAVVAWSMITPLGDTDATVEALFAGRSGFVPVPSHAKLRNSLAAVIAERPSHAVREGAWQRHLATRVLRDVLASAAIDPTELGRRCALVFATSFGHLLDDGDGETMSTWARDCVRSLPCDLEPIVVGSGCSSGSDAIAVAAAMLDSGAIDVAIVVAVDIVTTAKRLAHSTLGTMAVDHVRPFDVRRSGMLLGEGAAALVLARRDERLRHRAELLGVGASNDAFGLTAPDPSGLSVRLALARALLAAGLGHGDLALYLAHGTGTQLNDELEAGIVAEVFAGNDALAVVGTKGALGHSLGVCGVIELIVLVELLNRRRAPPTVGLAQPIECVAARFPGPDGRPLAGPHGVSVTLGFGGFNTAIVARAC